MRQVCCAGVLVVLLAACGGSSDVSSHAIVLDHSLGSVRLLEKKSDVDRALGKGATLHNDQHYGHEVRYSEGLDVFYAPGPKHQEVAFAVMTTSRRYRTRSGVGVGSSQTAVESLDGVHCYGPTQCQHGAAGQGEPGTAFAIRDGKVWRVAIATDFG